MNANTPTTLDELFPSKYLRAADVEENQVFTIKSIDMEVLKNKDTQKDETKPILYFEETEKGIVLNKTNKNTLEQLYGTVIADLIGKRVILHTPDVEGFGKVAPAIRIKAQRPATDKAALLDRYQKLWERGKKVGLENIDSYVIAPNMDEQEIKDLGIELRKKVEAAENF